MKLNLKMPFEDLAYRFNVSVSTVSRTFQAWMIVMDVRLQPFIKWPDHEALWRTMRECFQQSFGKKVTVIIDCFEIFLTDHQFYLHEHKHSCHTNIITL